MNASMVSRLIMRNLWMMRPGTKAPSCRLDSVPTCSLPDISGPMDRRFYSPRRHARPGLVGQGGSGHFLRH